MPPTAADESLNLKQVASQLGVHYMTAYRYVRQGRLTAWRDGTNWRIEPAALAEFVASSQAPGETGEAVDWPTRTADALLAHDETAAWSLIERALAAGHDPAYCFIDMIGAALAEIDRRSAGGEFGASTWPAVTVVAERLVARLGARFRRPGRRRGAVVIGGPTGEHHQIPISILADLVRLEGFDVIELGVDTSPAAFADAASRAERLHAVAIGVTTIQQLDATRQAIAAVRVVAPTVPIIIGGQGVRNPDLASVLDADAWAPDGRTAATTVSNARPRSPTPGTPVRRPAMKPASSDGAPQPNRDALSPSIAPGADSLRQSNRSDPSFST